MAKIESMVGFVTEWKYGSDDPNPKWAMKVSEPHSKKDGDKWVKVGSTNYTIKAAYGVDIDFTKFGKNDRVEVKGEEKKKKELEEEEEMKEEEDRETGKVRGGKELAGMS